MVLETERLILRELTEEDATDLTRLDSDPDVMRFLGGPSADTLEQHRAWVRDRAMPYYTQHPGYGFFAAIEKATGVWLGWFILRPALHYRFATDVAFAEGEVELGYRLMPFAWGKGYGTEGARALVAEAFARPDVEAVVAVTLLTNTRSWHIMEKLGMARVGEYTLPKYDVPAVTYRLPRPANEG